jgi:hypothetical protein
MAGERFVGSFAGEPGSCFVDDTLQQKQALAPFLDVRPYHTRTTQSGKRADSAGAQLQDAKSLAGEAHRSAQILEAIRFNVAEELQRDVELLGPGPSEGFPGQRVAEFVLRPCDLVLHGFGEPNGNEYPDWHRPAW